MEYAVLTLIACALGAGTAGGFLASWSCHRRLLALEENLKVILGAYDDRLNLLNKIVTRQDKSEAAKVRWSNKDAKDEEAIAALSKLGSPSHAAPHPWDPRTWGSSG